MRSTLALLSTVALLAGCEDPAPPPAETVVEAGQIQIVHPDEYLEESDGTALLRKLATRSRGSNRVEFQHVVLTEALEGGPVTYDSQDEFVYVLKGQIDLTTEGQTHHIGPGSFFFVPQGSPYDFKVIEAPLEVVAVFSPPGE